MKKLYNMNKVKDQNIQMNTNRSQRNFKKLNFKITYCNKNYNKILIFSNKQK